MPDGNDDFINTLFAKASADPRRIVLSEGTSSRVQEAAARAVRRGLARITLLGPEREIRQGLTRFCPGEHEISIVDPRKSIHIDRYTDKYLRIRKHKAPNRSTARSIVAGELGHAAMMVRTGDADGTIGGATNTTADTIRAFLQIIGLEPGCDLVSAFIFMLPPSDSVLPNAVLFADCALIVEPDERQLATIAESTAKSAQAFLDIEPRIALLSFSTAGSGSHPKADVVRAAVETAHERLPTMVIPHEMQFDAAVDHAIQKRKLPSGKFFGTPNVFIFPGLEAANIGYKIAERIGGMKAIGTVLQGLAKPANDLSRGCSADDILALIAVTCVQAQAKSASTDQD